MPELDQKSKRGVKSREAAGTPDPLGEDILDPLVDPLAAPVQMQRFAKPRQTQQPKPWGTPERAFHPKTNTADDIRRAYGGGTARKQGGGGPRPGAGRIPPRPTNPLDGDLDADPRAEEQSRRQLEEQERRRQEQEEWARLEAERQAREEEEKRLMEEEEERLRQEAKTREEQEALKKAEEERKRVEEENRKREEAEFAEKARTGLAGTTKTETEKELTAGTTERAATLNKAIAAKDYGAALRALEGTESSNKQLGEEYLSAYKTSVGAALPKSFKDKKLQALYQCFQKGFVPIVNQMDLADGDTNALIAAFEGAPGHEQQEFVKNLDNPSFLAGNKKLDKVLTEKGLKDRFRKGYVDKEKVAAELKDSTLNNRQRIAVAVNTYAPAIVARLEQRKSKGFFSSTDEKGAINDAAVLASEAKSVVQGVLSEEDTATFLEQLQQDDRVRAKIKEVLGTKTDADKASLMIKGGGREDLPSLLAEKKVDSVRVLRALSDLSPKEREAYQLGEGGKVPEARTKLIADLKRLDVDRPKALGIIDGGSPTSGIASLRHNTRKSKLNVYVSDRDALDAVMKMTGPERQAFVADTELRDRVKKGVDAKTWTQIQDLLGLRDDATADKTGEVVKVNNKKFATKIIDALDKTISRGEGEAQQVLQAAIEAEAASKKDPPEADLKDIGDQVRYSGVLTSGLHTSGETKHVIEKVGMLLQIDPAALKAKPAEKGDTDDKAASKSARIAFQFAIEKKKPACFTAVLGSIPDKELLEDWSNIGELRKRIQTLQTAIASKDPSLVTQSRGDLDSFAMDLDAKQFEPLKAVATEKQFGEMARAVRAAIIKASGSSGEVQGLYKQANVSYDAFEAEKSKLAQANEDTSFQRGGGRDRGDMFSWKGAQADTAGANLLGEHRRAQEKMKEKRKEQAEGKMDPQDLAAERKQAAKDVSGRREHLENRLKAYQELKDKMARIAKIVAATILGAIAAGVTAGAAGPLFTALIIAGIQGALGSTADLLIDHFVQGKGYDFEWTQLLAPVKGALISVAVGGVVTGLTSAAGAAVKAVQGGAFGDAFTKEFVNGISGLGADGAQKAIWKEVATTVVKTPIIQVAKAEGIHRFGHVVGIEEDHSADDEKTLRVEAAQVEAEAFGETFDSEARDNVGKQLEGVLSGKSEKDFFSAFEKAHGAGALKKG